MTPIIKRQSRDVPQDVPIQQLINSYKFRILALLLITFKFCVAKGQIVTVSKTFNFYSKAINFFLNLIFKF